MITTRASSFLASVFVCMSQYKSIEMKAADFFFNFLEGSATIILRTERKWWGPKVAFLFYTPSLLRWVPKISVNVYPHTGFAVSYE